MAEELARAALGDYPEDPNFLTVLGAALGRTARYADAEDCLRRAIASDPGYAKAHEQLGIALLARQQPAAAIAALRRALELEPGLEPAKVHLSEALLAAGRQAEAKAVFDDFVGQKPHRALLARGARDHRAGRLQEAETAYREVLRHDPANVLAIRMLGRLAMEAEHYRDAMLLLRRAVQLAPEFRPAWLDLGQAQTECYELEEAVASYRRAIALGPDRADGYVGLGHALARSQQTLAAVDAYRRAAELRPEQPGIRLGLGNVLKTIGRQAEAIAAYREGLRLQPDFAELWWSLANLKTYRFAADEVATMERILARPDLPAEPATQLSFALGKAAEDAREFDRAFGYFERGNRLRREREHYDPVHTERVGEQIRAVFSPALLARLAGHGYAGAAPIFIIGLPRSGSTLIEQILASHSEVEATFELPEAGRLVRFIDRQRIGGKVYPEAVAEMPPALLGELGRRYDRETRRFRAGAPRFVDKMPNNFATVGLLHLILPEARFINTRRHPLDSCLSCFRQLFARGQSFTYDLVELGEYYLEYQRMMDHWHAVLPGRVLDVHYESVVSDLEGEARRILAFCGLPWQDSCLRFHETERPVRTASSEQVRRPIYTDAVGFWRNYADHLQPLMETLRPVLERYPPQG